MVGTIVYLFIATVVLGTIATETLSVRPRGENSIQGGAG
jgi:hypothetical protein